MRKTFGLATLAAIFLATPVLADEYIEFPVEPWAQSIKRSDLTHRAVVLPYYRHVFQVRVYTTPPQPPYYNVPPYEVLTPY